MSPAAVDSTHRLPFEMTEPKQPDLPDVPRWQKLLALVVAIGVVALIVIFNDRIGADFWPLDRSTIGPNLLASVIQAAFLLLVVALVWPPTRRWIFHQFRAVHEKLDWHHERQHAHNEWMAQHVAETYRHTTGKEPEPHPHFDVSKKPTP